MAVGNYRGCFHGYFVALIGLLESSAFAMISRIQNDGVDDDCGGNCDIPVCTGVVNVLTALSTAERTETKISSGTHDTVRLICFTFHSHCHSRIVNVV